MNNTLVSTCSKRGSVVPNPRNSRYQRCSTTRTSTCSRAQREASRSEWNDDIVKFDRSDRHAKVTAPEGCPPIVLLPGFGNNTSDYTAPFGNVDASIGAALHRRGFNVKVVELERKDWIKVAKAAFTINFWRQKLTTNPGYDWYIQRIVAAVAAAKLEHGSEQVILMGHSAGGWLGRAFLGDPRWSVDEVATGSRVEGAGALVPHPSIRMIVTLGSPHLPPVTGSTRDMTGGALIWLNEMYPHATFVDQGVDYVCVGGRTVTGRKRTSKEAPRTPATYAHDAYSQVCGTGEGVIGDGVVPLDSAILQGAENIELPGVLHSMSKLGTFEEDSGFVWYGSEDVIDMWLQAVVTKLANDSVSNTPATTLDPLAA